MKNYIQHFTMCNSSPTGKEWTYHLVFSPLNAIFVKIEVAADATLTVLNCGVCDKHRRVASCHFIFIICTYKWLKKNQDGTHNDAIEVPSVFFIHCNLNQEGLWMYYCGHHLDFFKKP